MASALRIASILAALSAASACHRQSLVASPADRRVANLHAFGRLYGVVRWFHPSDTAASTDWDNFAIEGVRRVMGASDAPELQAELGALFQRVAPTVVVVGPGEPWPAPPPPPADASHLELVSWQHEGFGDSSFSAGTFASKRTHRDRIAAVAGAPYGMLWQAVDATPFRGATVRLRGKLRVARPGRATLWLRVERDTETRFNEEMRERPVVSTTWQSVEITGPVAADATRIVFGPRTQDRGASWYDDLELAVQRSLAEHGHRSRSTTRASKIQRSRRAGTPASATRASRRPMAGTSSSIMIARRRDRPRSGSSSSPTRSPTSSSRRPRCPARPSSSRWATASAHACRCHSTRATAIPSAMAQLEHFWPYWDLMPLRWDHELDIALADALDDRSISDHVATMKRLSVALPDAHATTTCTGEPPRASAPFVVKLIEGQLVVTRPPPRRFNAVT